MRVTLPLDFQVLSAHVADLPADAVLGMMQLAPPAPRGPAVVWPVQTVQAPLLATEDGARAEYWLSRSPCRYGQVGDIHFGVTADVLFGVIALDEAGMRPSAGETGLQAAASSAYQQLFTLLVQQGFPHLWRVWNYVPEINRVEHGLERYRQFNLGRHQAFVSGERSVEFSPAACALGVARGPLSIAFLAARTPAQRIENPRQVSAFAYPASYGPRSPTFTRAALARLPGEELLFLSGTASIVGHQTCHPGNVVAQTQETMTNIAVLLQEANRVTPQPDFSLGDLHARVYLRHADDLAAVRQTLAAMPMPMASLCFVQADVCRQDLLVEIEAHALRAAPA